MSNVFPYSSSNKRYHTFDHYLKQTYGSKVAKVTVNGMFNCPNRDGTVATGSCYFCSDRGSGDFAGDAWKTLKIQYDEQKAKILKKWPKATKFIVYFQANTNTHDTVANLKLRFEQFTTVPEIVAISIGTRPDCLPEAVLDYLADLNKRKPVWIEMGLQTIHDQTAAIFNRAYPSELCFEKIRALRQRNISVAIHLINSLPGETKEMMIDSVKKVASYDVQSIKIHMLHIVKNSPWGLRYAAERWNAVMSMDQYVDTVIEQLKWIPAHIHLERLTGDPDKRQLLTPTWTLNKTEVLNAIDTRMKDLNVWQGMNVEPPEPVNLLAMNIISDYLKPAGKALSLTKNGDLVRIMLANRAGELQEAIDQNRQRWADLAYVRDVEMNPTNLAGLVGQMKNRGKILMVMQDGAPSSEANLQTLRDLHVYVKEKHPLEGGRLLLEARV